MIAASISCYQIKYRAKQKHLLPFYTANNELKEVLYQWFIIKIGSKNDIKNRTFHHFDDIMRVVDIRFDNILL